jgi:hypothetical protein
MPRHSSSVFVNFSNGVAVLLQDLNCTGLVVSQADPYVIRLAYGHGGAALIHHTTWLPVDQGDDLGGQCFEFEQPVEGVEIAPPSIAVRGTPGWP